MSDAATATIGQVQGLLAEEFPDVTTSKIRFLESMGMITPSRTPSGYRVFGPGDIQRIRFILHRQREQFLPLKVIKGELARIDRGEMSYPQGPDDEKPDVEQGNEDATLDGKELARHAGITSTQVRRLVEHRILTPVHSGGQARYKASDVAVARHCGLLLREGLEARHIRQIHQAAMRHMGLLDSLTMASHLASNPVGRRRAQEVVDRCSAAMQTLYQLFIQTEAKARYH